MCVIMIVSKDGPRPTPIMVEKAWAANDHGAGIAWREVEKGERVVRWHKGLNEKDMAELCKTVPMPYVAHWRIASSGGIREELTHPFPIDLKAPLDLEGKTKGFVLFHNGTWGTWDDAARYAAMQKDVQIPVGKWSDSRAMAWLMSMYGNGFMELLPVQRGVAFGPNKMDIFTGPGFKKVNDIWCSNEHFMDKASRSNSTHTSQGNAYQMCQYIACTSKDLDSDKRCPKHPKTSFPTSGYDTKISTGKTGPQGVSDASQTPFRQTAQGQIISVAVATLLRGQKNLDGSRRLSQNKFKKVKQLHSRVILGGRKGEKARTQLIELSGEILPPLRGLRA